MSFKGGVFVFYAGIKNKAPPLKEKGRVKCGEIFGEKDKDKSSLPLSFSLTSLRTNVGVIVYLCLLADVIKDKGSYLCLFL